MKPFQESTVADFQKGRIVVVGSVNMDLVVRTPRLPNPGETLSGHSFVQIPGGKGANQAVAAARLGAQVAMIGCTGLDSYGTTLRTELENNSVDCGGLAWQEHLPTGVALIVVDDTGQNAIIVVPGTNGAVTPAMISRHERLITKSNILICQMEVPEETVLAAMKLARQRDRIVVLNPAPVHSPLPSTWLELADFLIPNEVEASILSGIQVDSVESAERAAKKLRQLGASNVIVTLGSQGVFALMDEPGEGRHYSGKPVKAVDTTAAGDTFIGGFSAKLAIGASIEDAISFGQAAAAISVTRLGAQTSIPFSHEVIPN